MDLFPKVSIIIPVFNGANFLKDAVDSALMQTYSNCEVIVINDGSTDDTEKIAKSYGNKIQYIYKENGGVASALNLGIEKMSGDYFVWLSHDDIFMKSKVEIQMKAIRKTNNKNMISFGNYIYHNEMTHTYTNTEFERYFDKNLIENSVFPLFWFELHFSSLLFHKNHFIRIGLFNESLITAQDNEFLFRLLRGQKTIFVTEPVSIVRLHMESGTNRNHKMVDRENRKLYVNMASVLSEKEIYNIHIAPSVLLSKVAGIVKSMGENNLEWIEDKIKSYPSLETKYTILHQNIYIIFGAGQYGIRLKYEMECRNAKIVCFVDNDKKKQNKMIDGIECLELEYALSQYPAAKIIIAQKCCYEATHQLNELNISDFYLKNEIDAMLLNIEPYKKG